jgi:hypothetical protein
VRPFLRRIRWRRVAKWILLTAAVLCASYLIAVNVLLRTRLLRSAISGPSVGFAVSGDSSDLQLDYQSAYSLFPGRVHLEGLTIRGRDRNVEWFLTLDRADVAISLVDLLHHDFHVTRLRSSGFSIRARLRLDRADATPDVVAALPPITGFADPPLRDDGPDTPPLTDAEYNLWTIDLEDVEVDHVREIWIHTVRGAGDTRVRGRWRFHPQRWLDVGPATVEANGVGFSYGDKALATDVRGSFGATVHPFDLRQTPGLAILDQVSYDGELRGRAAFANMIVSLAPRSGIRFDRWEGPFAVHLVLDHGRLADGTHVRTEATDCQIAAESLALDAMIGTEVSVDGGLATIGAQVTGLRVSGLDTERAHVASIAVTVTSRELQLTRLGGDAGFTLEVGGAGTSDISAWQTYLPSASSLVIRSGRVNADGRAAGSLVEGGGWATGTATIGGDDLAAGVGSAVVSGGLAAHLDLRRWGWTDRRVDLSGSDVVLRAVSARSARSGVSVLVVPSLTVVAPRLVFDASGLDGHASIDLPRAELAHLGGLGELINLPRGLAIEDGSGRARLHGDVELSTGSWRGDGVVGLRGIRARAGSTELFGDLDGTVKARRTEGAGASTDLSGTTLAVRHAGTGNPSALEDAWWANATLTEAALWTRGGVSFHAKAHVSAKDASPATALVSQNTSVPAWATDIFRMPVLHATADLRVASSSFEVRSLLARGGNTSVRAEYSKRDGRQDGAVLLDLGWIDLGYDLADGSSGLVLLGPEAWFARRVATLRDTAASASRTADTAEQLASFAAMTPGARRTLAARCALEVRSCDGASIDGLLRMTGDAREREALSGTVYAPIVAASAKHGMDGATLDPLVVASVAEALRVGGESTLDHLPSMTRIAAATDHDAARGKVLAVAGRVSSNRREGQTSVGLLLTDAEPIYFVTPFATPARVPGPTHFRGVFVERYSPPEGQPSLVLVGAFAP